MICHKCAAVLGDASRFCPKCGSKIEAAALEFAKSKICPECGTQNAIGAKFCKADGYRFGDESGKLASPLGKDASGPIVAVGQQTKAISTAKLCKKDGVALLVERRATSIGLEIAQPSTPEVSQPSPIKSESVAIGDHHDDEPQEPKPVESKTNGQTTFKPVKTVVAGALAIVCAVGAGGYWYFMGHIQKAEGIADVPIAEVSSQTAGSAVNTGSKPASSIENVGGVGQVNPEVPASDKYKGKVVQSTPCRLGDGDNRTCQHITLRVEDGKTIEADAWGASFELYDASNVLIYKSEAATHADQQPARFGRALRYLSGGVDVQATVTCIYSDCNIQRVKLDIGASPVTETKAGHIDARLAAARPVPQQVQEPVPTPPPATATQAPRSELAAAPVTTTSPVSQAKSLDELYNERTSAECPSGLKGLLCREKVKWSICDGKWAANPQAGQSICKGADSNASMH